MGHATALTRGFFISGFKKNTIAARTRVRMCVCAVVRMCGCAYVRAICMCDMYVRMCVRVYVCAGARVKRHANVQDDEREPFKAHAAF